MKFVDFNNLHASRLSEIVVLQYLIFKNFLFEKSLIFEVGLYLYVSNASKALYFCVSLSFL